MISSEQQIDIYRRLIDHLLEAPQAEFSPTDVIQWITGEFADEEKAHALFMFGHMLGSGIEQHITLRLIELGVSTFPQSALAKQIAKSFQHKMSYIG